MLRKTGDPPRWLAAPSGVSGKATAITFARVFIGLFWIFEVTVGHNWKIGGFGSGTNPGWIGPSAGDTIRENIAEAVENGTWSWAEWLFVNLIEPNAVGFSYFVVALQVAFGLFFIFGFAVRPTALVALLFDLSVMLLGNSRIPPFFTVAHLFLLYSNAGMYYGVDGWLTKRLRGVHNRAAQVARWLLDLPLLTSTRAQVAVLSTAVLLSGYFFMQVFARETDPMSLVAMDLAVLLGLIAAGFYFGRWATDRLAVVAALLRVFVGYKLLHEIWVRVEPGVNALPGWASEADQREVFETISTEHWAPFAWITDNLVLPALGLWVVVFGIVQLVVGAALVIGYRTRLAAAIGLVYVGGLGVLGFSRYAPFVFGLLVVVLALDAGRTLGLDSGRLEQRPPRYGLPIPKVAIAVLVALAAVNAVAAAIAVITSGGIAPDGYTESMGQMTTAMVAIFSALFALGGWLQLRAGERAEERGLAGVASAQPDPAKVS
jgi:hypothetical protein